MARISKKDYDLLNANQAVNLSSPEYAYLGGEFTTNSNDYIEVLIYSGENLLESAIVDKEDYSYTNTHSEHTVDIRIKTGTVLRKLGYDRGVYTVKYNFFRKTAGSYETLLVDESGNIYTGAYHVKRDGSLMIDQPHTPQNLKPLFLKENKYVIQEISDSRKEVRLVAQNINDPKYKNDFYSTQVKKKKITIDKPASFVADSDSEKGNSLTMKLTDLNVGNELLNGYVFLENAFIEKTLPPPSAGGETDGAQTGGEVESNIVQAQFIISDDSRAEYIEGDRTFSKIFEVFKDGSYPNETALGYEVVDASDKSNTLVGIRRLHKGNMHTAKYKDGNFGESTGGIITVKSVSSKPNTATTYTWTLLGWDRDSKTSYGKTTYDWKKIFAAAGGGDVQILSPTPTTQRPLQVIDKDKLDGSEITFQLLSKHVHVGIKLEIDTKSEKSEIFLPACIGTPA